MTSFPFLKLEALGNDFLVVMRASVSADRDLNALAREMCDRHYGAGSDGLAVLEQSATDKCDPDNLQAGKPGSDFRFWIFNADGSEAEMSGNGIRCAAAALQHWHVWSRPEVAFETRAGVRTVKLSERERNFYVFDVKMGRPMLSSSDIPMALEPGRDCVVDYAIDVDCRRLHITASSIGNPHCTIFSDELTPPDFFALAAQIESHQLFPNGTNVEWVRVVDRDSIEVTFWERGVGKTLSSGTGSCAAVVASRLRGLVDEVVSVYSPAGVLIVEWRPEKDDGQMVMSGPAEVVFEGRWLT